LSELGPKAAAARRSPLWILLALAPIVWIWGAKVVVEPRPFWVHYYDPEAIYFFEGLDLARLRPPESFDRPGAPVQLLSALLVLARGSTALDFDGFRFAAYLATLGLLAAGTLLLFRTALRDLPGPAAVAGVWVYYAAPQSLEYLAVWSPETLYLPLGALALAGLWRAARLELDGRSLFLAGLGVGTLCATKLTFLPWAAALALATLLAAGDLRHRLRRTALALGGVGAAFLAWTLHLLPRLGGLLSWIWRLLSRGGEYGRGDAGLPTVAEAAANLAALLRSAKGWHLLLLLLLAGAAAALLRAPADERSKAGPRWLLAFVALALALTLLFGVRQPVGRYYLPNGLVAVLLVALVTSGRSPRSSLQPSPTIRGALALAAVALLAGKQALLDLDVHQRRIEGESGVRSRLEAARAELERTEGEGVVVWGFRAPIPSLALHVMARSAEDHAEIFRAYPREGFVDWLGELRLPPGAERWAWLALQENEAPDADALCARERQVDRFAFYSYRDCGERLRELPGVDRRGERRAAGPA